MVFGQFVVGPPGCGKSTYCHGLSQFYTGIERPFAIVNLDPANDLIPYKADVDVSELINLNDVMDKYGLGPNGALIYCMEYLESNVEWLLDQIKPLKSKYLIFDCPGQVELFTNHQSLKRIIERLQKMDVRLCVVHLVDSHYCVDPSRFVSMLMVSLKTMLQFECPQVNVLSKVDLMESYGSLGDLLLTLDFKLEYYTQVQDLSYLLDRLNQDPFTKRYKELNSAICDLVQDFGLVGFLTLCVEDKESMLRLTRAVDKANGFVFGGLEEANDSIFQTADRWEAWDRYNRDVEEKYLNSTDPTNFDDDLIAVKDVVGSIQENSFDFN
jgi:GPN-loop GTPase